MSVLAPARTARHRRSSLRDTVLQAVDVISKLGTVVTLAALLVVAGAVGGLFDSGPSDATVTVTYGSR